MSDTSHDDGGLVQFIVRMPDHLREDIRDTAERNQRSMNSEILHRLQATGQLRDEFAMRAMAAIATSTGNGWIGGGDYKEVAVRAYMMADAMLAERSKSHG